MFGRIPDAFDSTESGDDTELEKVDTDSARITFDPRKIRKWSAKASQPNERGKESRTPVVASGRRGLHSP
jgi:hypothetical protein